ncbi:sugar/nucleoside kinase (ribokinase family) [Amycolatopsis lexingtonensis]|uniref:Sugar/nucleoside kinase (Ribokinase family) n=1 Tax=Amycolatopsis lexingtonensis TaxID=218822 RepID=A0ABR9I1G2_9PSEU|nr:carbohydrate kinase family protein [Amycolatopsis lexingtonensis]MBE1497003.1 sugar/nucleoside kinase (ribokinase family) [Amycolatopsis lexingtonensis]
MNGIVVVGDAALDVIARHDKPLPHGGDARAKIRFTGGGSGANTALWLRSLGAETTLLARIGNDPGGRLIRAELEAAGVRCAFAVDDEAPTCCVVVMVDGSGQRSMLADRGANQRFAPEDVTPEALAGASHLHLSGYVLLDPPSRAAGLAALAAAREAGLTTSVDPQAAAHITDPAAFLDDVRGVDLLMPNTEELVALTGSADPVAAKELLGAVGAVVVTAGLDGASWVDQDGVTSVPAVEAECIDSTGAGDAFDAGVLTGWLAGESTVDVLRHGTRLGALAVGKVGPQPA